MSRLVKKIVTLMVPLALALAWAGGNARVKEATTQRLQNISPEITGVVQVDENLFQGHLRGNPNQKVHLAHASRPSYGGPLTVAVAVDDNKIIQHVAILSSTDTQSYLEKVVGLGTLGSFAGQSIGRLPEVDAVSGATLSSSAIIQGVEAAAGSIGAARFGMPSVQEEPRAETPETAKLIIISLFFLAALLITRKSFGPKKKARSAILFLSAITLGFWLGAQFSLSTVVTLLSGAWLSGMATYAALLCLVLAVGVFLVTKKNLFCQVICPFGAVQEGLSTITGCSAPKRFPWMDWIARAWVLSVLMAALYFQAPSDAMFEPFSKAFNFIGSGIVYSLTILIVIASLMVKRPWCHLFCPTKSLFYYLRFARNSFSKKTGKQTRKKEKVMIS